MVADHMLDAEKALVDALSEYEGNGIRYEPHDREALQDLIIQVEKLRQRLTYYMHNLPSLDHHPIGKRIVDIKQPRSVAELFEELEGAKFISPEGPLHHNVPFKQLKELFLQTDLSIVEAYLLLHKTRAN
jgi:hypothetical protein